MGNFFPRFQLSQWGASRRSGVLAMPRWVIAAASSTAMKSAISSRRSPSAT